MYVFVLTYMNTMNCRHFIAINVTRELKNKQVNFSSLQHRLRHILTIIADNADVFVGATIVPVVAPMTTLLQACFYSMAPDIVK